MVPTFTLAGRIVQQPIRVLNFGAINRTVSGVKNKIVRADTFRAVIWVVLQGHRCAVELTAVALPAEVLPAFTDRSVDVLSSGPVHT